MRLTCIQNAICSFGEQIEVLRSSSGAYVKGRWESGSEETIPIKANVQPADGADLERLSEGRRVHETIKIYSTFELRMIDKEKQIQPDVVVWKGKRFLIEHVDNWSSEGYFKSIGVKME